MPSSGTSADRPSITDLRQAIDKVVAGKELSEREATEAFELVMAGEATPAQLGAFLVALKMRGEAVSEITGAAKVLRDKVRKVQAPEGAIDTCGTGGDAKGTHNISTCAAFVVAGAGLPVAKHGNRSVSSRSGSADVLAELGVAIELEPEHVTRCINEAGLGFMFAPSHHAAMRHVAPVRKELGMRTIFNLLGPLANPAETKFQLIGVYGKEWVQPVAEVLGRLGVKRAWVVHGADGLDELTTTTISHVAALDQGRISTFNVSPKNAGLREAKPQDLLGGDAAENAAHIRAVLEGMEGPFRDIVLFNAGAALMVGGKAKSLRDGVALASDAIDSGKAKAVLEKLVAISQDCVQGNA